MKKLLITLLVALLVLSGCKGKRTPVTDRTSWSTISGDAQESFDKWQRDWFVEDAQNDYTSMRFNMKDPAKYGITDYEVSFGEVFSEDDSFYQDKLKQLLEFDKTQLNKDQQLTYESLKFFLEKTIEGYTFENEFGFSFTPNSGINNNLITIFTEFVFRNENDVKEFITLLHDVPRVIDEAISATRGQAEDGYVQADSVIDSVVEQVNRFLSAGENNEIIVAFNDKVGKLNLSNHSEYEAQVKDVVYNEVVPSYQRIVEMYDGLRGSCTTNGSLYDYEGGAEYFKLLVERKLGEKSSLETISDGLLDAVYENIQNIYSLMNSVSLSSGYAPDDVYEIMNQLKEKSAKDFTPLVEVNYTIDYLNPTVTSDNVSAYYVNPPYDALEDNVIKVNPTFAENDPDGLVSTLGHEGYPGHLYQIVYYFANHPNSEIRQVVDYLGFAEGWAQYAGLKSYEYFLTNAKEIKYLQSFDKFSYCSYAYCDIMINYFGWTIDDCVDFYSQFYQPETAKNIGESIFETNIGDPGVFLPYSWGMIKMVDYHDKAKEALGSKFSELELNKLIANIGNVPFFVLDEEVNNYIQENK